MNPPPLPSGEKPGSEIQCPNCGSSGVQSAPMVYQSGTVRMRGIVTMGESGGVGKPNFGLLDSTSSSLIAQRVRPPVKKTTGCIVVFLQIGVGIFSIMLLPVAVLLWVCPAEKWQKIAMSLGLIVPVALIIFAFSLLNRWGKGIAVYNNKIWPMEYETWRNSWLCHRCGHVWKLATR
jgi:hypothetical protein